MSDSFRQFVIDQLSQVTPGIRQRAMFGGTGIYAGELFFALIAYDNLFLKVDDSNRPSFVALGSKPFQPFENHGAIMGYYEVPLEVLESVPRLRPFVDGSLAVAEQAKKKKKPKGKAKTKAAKNAKFEAVRKKKAARRKSS